MKSFTSSIKFSSKRCSSLCFEVKKKKKGKKKKFLIVEFHEHASDYFENLARRYRVSALTRYSVARDKYSIERRFTVNWVRNLQWCIVVLYRRERERERTREQTAKRVSDSKSRSPFLLVYYFYWKTWCWDICITDRFTCSFAIFMIDRSISYQIFWK